MEEAQTMNIDAVSCIPMLRRYALKLARNGPDADDLVQDCLLRALTSDTIMGRQMPTPERTLTWQAQLPSKTQAQKAHPRKKLTRRI